MELNEFSTELKNHIEKLIKEVADKAGRPATEIIYDDLDLQKMLKISRRTSLEYRQKGYLRSHKLDGKIYYFLSEILEDIKNRSARGQIEKIDLS